MTSHVEQSYSVEHYVSPEGITYLSGPDLVAWLERRLQIREAARSRRLEEDPPGLRDPDPGPLLARDVLVSLRKGLGMEVRL